ncbi:unnamed protein product [Litomosoides sigmodontis]|uniref:Uncharacterized protein n=1 Tax=Litomosoides sigmodontis TaxID=42156 RepID=A0A3P6TQB1_LITSI|nr:unnamed protein product [Litomosoides sigmodontis]
MVESLEDCIWGKTNWSAYTEKLVGATRIDEGILLERINVVKENIGQQIREAVEQHHPRLVEQASALQNLDRVQATINREMSHLYKECKELGEKFQFDYEKLYHTTSRLEQLYALRRILASAYRCDELVEKLGNTTELVKRSEIICELEAITTEIPSLKDLNSVREMVLVSIPKLTAEARQNTASHLRSSLESLSAPLVSSCIRALNNFSSYEFEISRLLEESAKRLDGQFLQLNSSTVMAAKLLPQIANRIQVLLEQYSLLGMEITVEFCELLAKIISRRVSENASYAARFVQLLSKVISMYPVKGVQPLDQSLRPLRRAILSHSLGRMFKAVDNAFEENNLTNFSVEKIDSSIKEELGGVEWDAQLHKEMKSNVAKVLQLVAQKIEQHLVLDSSTLQMSERLSTAQYIADHGLSLYNVQSSLISSIPEFVDAFKLPAEQLVQSKSLPFCHGAADRLDFLSSLMRSYTSAVVSSSRTEYVTNYPLIMSVLQKIALILNITSLIRKANTIQVDMGEIPEEDKRDSKTVEQEEEWESKTVILEVGGIMDVNAARQALNRSDCAIRRCSTENPILQISNSLFTAEWNSIIGTDMIFKLEEKQLRFVECSDVRLKAEKALIIDNDDK